MDSSMNSDTKALLSTPCDVPYKILSEKDMERVQFKARQRLLELKEEEQWKKYCREQISIDEEGFDGANETLLSSAEPIMKEENMKLVAPKKNTVLKTDIKVVREPVKVIVNKSKAVQVKSPPHIQVSHFQKTLLGKSFGFPVPGKLNVLNVQKELESTVGLGCSNKGNSTSSSVPTRLRIVKAMNLPNLEYVEVPLDLKEMQSYSEALGSVGFTLPYPLQYRRYLTRKAYSPLYPKTAFQHRKNTIPTTKTVASANISKRNHPKTATAKTTNTEVKSLAVSETKNSRSQENVDTESKKTFLNGKPKPVPSKKKKFEIFEKEVVEKVSEEVLNETLEHVILEVEKEKEEIKRSLIQSQLNSLLQKLNDIESPSQNEDNVLKVKLFLHKHKHEESLIHHRWQSLMEPRAKHETLAVSPSEVPESSAPMQQKSVQSIMDKILQEAAKNSEYSTEGFGSETATSIKGNPPHSKNSNDSENHQDGKYIINPVVTESNEKTATFNKTFTVCDLNPEIEVSLSRESIQRIYNYKKSFRQHMKQSSELSKQFCSFWNVSTETADQILEECLQEIAEELSEIPSSLITDLYNQEFERSLAHS